MSVEPPTSVLQPTQALKPSQRSSTPVSASPTSPPATPAQPVPETEAGNEELKQAEKEPPLSSNALFQAIGIIVGDVHFDQRGKGSLTIEQKSYPLLYSATHKKAYDALKLTLKNTGQHRQRLLVYPQVKHLPPRERPYRISFQLVGFKGAKRTLEHGDALSDFEFKLCGLWQFIPVCPTPCLSIFKNFTDERLAQLKEASVEQRVQFMKASHIPVLWPDAAVEPFRFNRKLDKQQQGHPPFVGIKAKFLPSQDVFEFCELQIQPVASPPKFLKARNKDKEQAMQLKKARGKKCRTGSKEQAAQTTKEPSDGDSTPTSPNG